MFPLLVSKNTQKIVSIVFMFVFNDFLTVQKSWRFFWRQAKNQTRRMYLCLQRAVWERDGRSAWTGAFVEPVRCGQQSHKGCHWSNQTPVGQYRHNSAAGQSVREHSFASPACKRNKKETAYLLCQFKIGLVYRISKFWETNEKEMRKNLD